ncbi:MAG: hypothetical protein AAGA80_28115, partial [Cyanobacteria bacterium P01_F01_bin.143]
VMYYVVYNSVTLEIYGFSKTPLLRRNPDTFENGAEVLLDVIPRNTDEYKLSSNLRDVERKPQSEIDNKRNQRIDNAASIISNLDYLPVDIRAYIMSLHDELDELRTALNLRTIDRIKSVSDKYKSELKR